MTVAEMRRRMSNQEFVEHAGFYAWRHAQQEKAARQARNQQRLKKARKGR